MLRALRGRSRLLVKPVLGSVIACCVILILEMMLRFGAFIWYDYSQYHLYYGFHRLAGKVGINPSSTETGNHYKFPPNYVLHDARGQAGETAAINSQGFRGPEFQVAKQPGTFRVVCLGESSTFGFHNGDTETYPFLLEEIFREKPGTMRVEVINAGFPYYNSGSILSLLQSEILSLEPDLLTIYSAYNDAHWPLHIGPLDRLTSWIRDHSMLSWTMKETILKDRFVMTTVRVDRESFEAQTSQIVARYRRTYEAIIAIARTHRIPIVVIKQPMTARYTHIQERQYRRSYEEEYQSVRRKFEAGRKLMPIEIQLLVHHRLLSELEAVVRREHVELVDNVAIVDQDRRLMASYVHLSAEANLRLARALKPVIEAHVSRSTRSSGPAGNLEGGGQAP